MEKAVQTLRKEFDTMIGRFLSSSVHANNSSPELEIRFGTNPQSRLTKMDYDNVVQQLYHIHVYLPPLPEGRVSKGTVGSLGRFPLL